MENNKKNYLKDLRKAQMFIDDYLPFEFSSANTDLLKEKVKQADELLTAVQNATLELEDLNNDEFELMYKEKTDIYRKKLSDFIKESQNNLKNNQNTGKNESVVLNTNHKSSKYKENKQEPRIFGKPPSGPKYKIGHILPCENSGYNMDVPIREFKTLAFDNPMSSEDKESAFIRKLGKFAGACMNARYNGTIYFGVADEKGATKHKHGEIIGINIKYSDCVHFEEWIEKYFKGKNPICLQTCSLKEKIAFSTCVSCLHAIELEDSDRIVLEVDIEPSFNITKYLNFRVNFTNNKGKGIYYLRNASSSFPITGKKEEIEFLKVKLPQLIRNRQELENDKKEMPSDNNIRLQQLICKGEPRIFDKKFHYFLIINSICEEPCCKMESIQDLEWISNIEWKAIFDFNPNSERNGALKLLNDCKDLLFKPTSITMEQIEDLFDADLKDHCLLNSYGKTILHITCCKMDEKTRLFTDWKGFFMPQLRKIFDFLTGPTQVRNPSDIAIIALCCSKEKEKEFLFFLTDRSIKYDILKQTSFLSQNKLHLKATTESIIEAYDNESETRNLPTLMRQNSLCLQWSVIDSFVKQITSNYAIDDKFVQSSSGIPIKVKRSIIEAFNKFGIYILASNECEELKVLDSEENKVLYNNTMIDFIRGRDPSWKLYFFFYNKLNIGKVVAEALIEREIVSDILKKINIMKASEDKCIDLIGIGHLPGTGASTIAMNVLWLLREKFRCLKIEGTNLKNEDLETLTSFTLQHRSFGEPPKLHLGAELPKKECLPLLILMDDTDYEVAKDFQRKIQDEVYSKDIKFRKTLGIIIFVHNNKLEESKCYNCFNLPQKFSKKESEIFSNKLKEFDFQIESELLQPEDMIGFLTLFISYCDTDSAEKQSIYKTRISKIILKIECALEGYPNEKLLLLILAIFKFYADSNLSLSHASLFLGYGDYENLIEDVCDHFKMLVRKKRVLDEFGDYEVVEMTHCQIAEVIIEKFLISEDKSVIDVLYEVFDNKSLINHLFLRQKLLKDFRAMVVRRKWKNEIIREKFSPLILELKNKNPDMAIKLLQKVIITLESLNIKQIDTGSAMIHQTLSRLYLNIDKLDLAKDSARKAIEINVNNFRYYDTLAQIYKKEVIYYFKLDDTKKIMINEILRSASEAIKNFKKSQSLYENQNANSTTKMDLIEDDFNDNDFMNPFIFQGYVGEITVNLCVAEKLLELANGKEEKNDVQRFISGKKGNLKPLAERYDIDLLKYGSLLVEIYDRVNKCMKAVMKRIDSNRNSKKYRMTEQLESLFEKFNKIFSNTIFKKLPNVIASSKTSLKDKLIKMKNYFEINFVEHLYRVHDSKHGEKLLLHEVVKAFKIFFENEKRDLKSLDMNFILIFLNANFALNPVYPIFEFDVACDMSKHIAQVETEMYEYYFWYTVLNWPTEKESTKSALAKTYDESLLVSCFDKLQNIHSISSIRSVKKRKHFLNHKPFYTLRNRIGYQKISFNQSPSSNCRLTGKIFDNKVEYILPYGTKLKIRCAYLRIPKGSMTKNVTFELGFSLAGPIAYNCKADIDLKSYNDDASSETI